MKCPNLQGMWYAIHTLINGDKQAGIFYPKEDLSQNTQANAVILNKRHAEEESLGYFAHFHPISFYKNTSSTKDRE